MNLEVFRILKTLLTLISNKGKPVIGAPLCAAELIGR